MQARARALKARKQQAIAAAAATTSEEEELSDEESEGEDEASDVQVSEREAEDDVAERTSGHEVPSQSTGGLQQLDDDFYAVPVLSKTCGLAGSCQILLSPRRKTERKEG